MNKVIVLIAMVFLTSSVFASSSACCSSQGGCGDKKSCQIQSDQKIIAEMLNLNLNGMQRDKFRAMLIRHKMERNKPLSTLREHMYKALTPIQKKELLKRLKNKKILQACK